jgi:hypothetical protein
MRHAISGPVPADANYYWVDEKTVPAYIRGQSLTMKLMVCAHKRYRPYVYQIRNLVGQGSACTRLRAHSCTYAGCHMLFSTTLS